MFTENAKEKSRRRVMCGALGMMLRIDLCSFQLNLSYSLFGLEICLLEVATDLRKEIHKYNKYKETYFFKAA